MIASRRTFLKTAALSGAALMVGFNNRRLFGAETAQAAPFKPNGWVRIDSGGTVTLTISKSEMGQGVRTALAMILADELGADWSRIKIVQASPNAEFTDLGTGGSGSMEDGWMMRRAAAAARAMLTTAAANRWKIPPDECKTERGAVLHEVSKRRLEFGELASEAAKLPVPKDTPLKKPADFQFIGQRTARIDGRDIVTGAARYGIDTKVPGMLYASVERPAFGGAKPKKMNEDAARAVRGVRSIVQSERGVAVVAENTWAAIKGRAALAVEWDEPPPDAFDSDAHAKKLEQAAHIRPNITRSEVPPAGAPPVARTIDAVYSYPFYAHAPVETMNCVADVRDDRCTIWAPTQAPNRLQKQVATLLGLAPEKVEVNVTLIGGGFGRRLAVDYALEAAEISRAAKAPVQVLWSRPDDMKHGHFQAASAHFLSVGLDAQSKPVAWKHTKAGSFHNLSTIGPDQLRDAAFYRGYSWGVYDFPYAVPAIETGYVPVDLPVLHGPWRAVFAPSSIFARESFIDEIAHECGSDPLEFRLQLLQGADTFMIGKETYDRRPLRRVLEIVRDKSEWTKKKVAERHGRGVACNIYDGRTHIAYVVDVAVDGSGHVKVERVVAAVDCGLVVNPIGIEQQIEGGIIWGISSALGGHITFQNGTAQQSTYADFEVARMKDAPLIEVHIVPSERQEPSGMGEPPVPPIVPAIVNAVFAATGRRLRGLPIRPEDLKA